MRVLIKGGVWKNTEDEILKVAVMKYGKNQWARISSLLTRKTPKQCKARWYEWLDPSIKKTEWSKEEDEKLLHLAKLMPTQWRTIAPIVGRTPAQCLERYQKLLDEAEAKEGGEGDVGPTGDDVRRLRPGEVDPDPETKPARPDPVDMDEDEKEMLSEARARLANTQGKKAKRKAREKQLEEARRLAALQKRRELKAAGIDIRKKRKNRGMDYNADIPFHHQAPAGFWDINEERDREENEKRGVKPALLQNLEGKRRADIEEQERRKDAKRQKTKKESGEYVPPQALRAAAEAAQKSARKPLLLPSPQVGEGELEEIVKIGYAGETAKAIVESETPTASTGLLADYSALRTGGPMRTPRTPAVAGDNLKQAARNLKAMYEVQTPLLGGDVNIEGDISFEGATPRTASMATPNPLAAQLTPRADGRMMTPRGAVGGIMGRTPLRDEMGINTPRSSRGGFEETPRGERARQNLIRQQLADHFSRLPKPKNDFEIVLPDSKENDEDAPQQEGPKGDEDMADVEARNRAALEREEKARLARRSQAVQRGLPRPVAIRSSTIIQSEPDTIERMIEEEMNRLLQYDAVHHPGPGQPAAANRQVALDPLTDEELDSARGLVEQELAKLKVEIDGLVGEDNEEFIKMHERVADQYMFVPDSFAKGDSGPAKTPAHFADCSKMSAQDLHAAYRAILDSNREIIKRDAARAKKLETKLAVTLGGYQKRSADLKRQLNERWKELVEAELEADSFTHLKSLEDMGAPVRYERLKKEVDALARRESELQERYAEQMKERAELMKFIETAQKRAKAMEEATNGDEDEGSDDGVDSMVVDA
ncbi:Pre-mRNA-splicing factor cef1 [Borealophlyctis nickersoniae]|nr:Pre-mRNA-splicing factor cef1 [Borealophlyctis nickersoniae]